MFKLSLLLIVPTLVIGAHHRKKPPIEISSSKASVTSSEARPLQINGADGTVATDNWKTIETSKSGSNVLISEGLNREQVVAEHQDFLKSDDAKGFDQYSTQYQTPYKPSKSRTFFVFVFFYTFYFISIEQQQY